MAGLFAVNGSIQVDDAVVTLGEGGDLHSSTVGDLLFQAPQQLLTDDLCHYLALGLVGGDIIGEQERRFNGVLLAFGHQCVHAVAGAGGNGNDGIEMICLRIGGNDLQQLILFYSVDLIDHQDHGGALCTQLLQKHLLLGTYGGDGFYHQQGHIHVSDGVLHSVDHVVAQLGLRLVETGGIHKDELGVFLGDDAADTVTGGLGFIGHDGDLLAYQVIGQSGFAHVGTTGDGNNGSFGIHKYILLNLSSFRGWLRR